MAIGLPFSPIQASTTTGAGVKVTANATPTSVAGTLTSTAVKTANNIVIANFGTVGIFARVSAEATPTATLADIPVPAGMAVVVQNPVPAGACGLAVLSSTTTACDVFFCPGEGGT